MLKKPIEKDVIGKQGSLLEHKDDFFELNQTSPGRAKIIF